MNSTNLAALKKLLTKMGGSGDGVKDNDDALEAIANAFGEPMVLVLPEKSTSKLFNTDVSDIQTDVSVINNVIIGELKWLSSGEIASYWEAGNFIALKFILLDTELTPDMVKAGLNNPVALDNDLNGVFKVADKDTQTFKVIVTKDGKEYKTDYKLSGLICDEEA